MRTYRWFHLINFIQFLSRDRRVLLPGGMFGRNLGAPRPPTLDFEHQRPAQEGPDNHEAREETETGVKVSSIAIVLTMSAATSTSRPSKSDRPMRILYSS